MLLPKTSMLPLISWGHDNITIPYAQNRHFQPSSATHTCYRRVYMHIVLKMSIVVCIEAFTIMFSIESYNNIATIMYFYNYTRDRVQYVGMERTNSGRLIKHNVLARRQDELLQWSSNDYFITCTYCCGNWWWKEVSLHVPSTPYTIYSNTIRRCRISDQDPTRASVQVPLGQQPQ